MTTQEAYQKATARCAMREYCRYDWYTKFKQQGLTAEEADTLVEQLVEEGYICETRFARAFAHDKMLYGRTGRLLVRRELRAKGIEEGDIVAAFDAVNEEEYVEILHKLLKQKYAGVRARNDFEAQQKVARYAISRGYEPDLVFRLLGHDE